MVGSTFSRAAAIVNDLTRKEDTDLIGDTGQDRMHEEVHRTVELNGDSE
jgi:hypothetical protein